ncbi:MAG: haloacid dehalogenase [Flavobacteriaceae bacterium]|nr:haloacid dehalogenase [Flavobacteriaceae bacterium]
MQLPNLPIKYIVSDMDGTLLDNEHQVSALFFELFAQLKEHGIGFIAASGRQYNSMYEKLAPIAQDVIFIAENGAMTMYKDELLHQCPLQIKDVSRIIDKVQHQEYIHSVLCCNGTALTTSISERFLTYLGEFYIGHEQVKSYRDLSHTVLKIALHHKGNAEQEIYPLVKSLEDYYKVKVSGNHWVDISHVNAHKGFALHKLLKDKGVHPEEIMVFGDFNNDIEMLELTPWSYAMGNAHPNVIKAANFQTLSNEEHGVEHILLQLLQQLEQ